MWIFTKTGFYSVVQKDESGPATLTVRTRALEDIHAFCDAAGIPKNNIQHNTGTDYPFRVVVSRRLFAYWITIQAYSIDYPNFKDCVHRAFGAFRSRIYARVWAILTEVERQELSK